MSFQRAYVNCMRCYGLARYILSDSRSPKDEDGKNNLLNSDSLYTARNEAMNALEDFGWDDHFRDDVTDLLKACVFCDYSKPTIAEKIEKMLKWKKK